jgi:hypothetical protein
MFRKKDGGISVVAKKRSEIGTFFDSHCKSSIRKIPSTRRQISNKPQILIFKDQTRDLVFLICPSTSLKAVSESKSWDMDLSDFENSSNQ